MPAYPTRRTLVIWSVALAACLNPSQPAAARRLRVDVQKAVFATVPRIVAAIGNIEPGASPVIRAAGGGQVTQILTQLGSHITPGEALASLQPTETTGPAAPAVIVRAPVAAQIFRMLISVGATVQAGQPLFGIKGKKVREARAPFPLRLASRLHRGQTVLLHSPLAPRSPLTGTVARLAVHPKRQVIYAFINLPARRGWTVGSPVRVDLVTRTYRALVIPKDAVHLRRIGTVVFVLHNGSIRMRRVEIRAYLTHRAVIRSGLAANARVITWAPGRLVSGLQVRVSRSSRH